MTEIYEEEIARLERDLATIYRRTRGGLPLTPLEKQAIAGLWARIERLEHTNTLIENKRKKDEGDAKL